MEIERNSRNTVLIVGRSCGLFSLVFQAAGQAYLAEQNGQTPVMYFNRTSPYWSDAGYRGERNVWEYYFEPLPGPRVTELFPETALEALEAFSEADFMRLAAGGAIRVTAEYPPVIEWRSPIGVSRQRKFVHEILRRYVRPKAHLSEMVDAFAEAHFKGNAVLGVHYRGMEKAEGFNGDGASKRPANLQDLFLRQIEFRLRQMPGAKVYLATDSAQFLAAVVAEFGSLVLSREATRLHATEERTGLHFSGFASERGPLLGEEVLLDAMLLARTQYFLHGISNVSNAVLFWNPKLEHYDIEVWRGPTLRYVKRELWRTVGRA